MYHDSWPIFVKEYYFNSNIILALKIIKSSISVYLKHLPLSTPTDPPASVCCPTTANDIFCVLSDHVCVCVYLHEHVHR